jgi:hypothetical protein
MSTEKKSTPPATPAAASPATEPAPKPAPAATAPIEDWLAYVRNKAETVKYGSLQIVVHDGRITQVEATEKFRLQPPPRTP